LVYVYGVTVYITPGGDERLRFISKFSIPSVATNRKENITLITELNYF